MVVDLPLMTPAPRRLFPGYGGPGSAIRRPKAWPSGQYRPRAGCHPSSPAALSPTVPDGDGQELRR